MAECIHGFDEGLCDICFPRRAAEPAPTVAASAIRTAPRATRSTRPRATRPPGAVAGSSGPKLPPYASRRLYHATHLRNLESILLDGEVRAIASGLVPDVDPVAPLVRQLRAHADVGDGRHVDEFVPFQLSPDADRWAELRAGGGGAEWTRSAGSPTDYVLLVAVAKDLGQDVVVADGDAAAPVTRFVQGEPSRGVAQAARRDPELTGAEVLVPGPVPLAAVNLIAVANEPVRARVRGMFADVEGVAPRVVVHPPWFQPAD